LTTALEPALKAAVPPEDVELPLLLLPLLLHAVAARATAAPVATAAKMLRLFMP
jgi:hypothetical protein